VIPGARNISRLAISQALMLSAVVVSMTLAGVLGAQLAPDKGLATLPIAAMVVGTALSSIPASLLMRRIGRRAGFLVGSAIGIAGSALAAFGLRVSCRLASCC
jgi:MFS family permease